MLNDVNILITGGDTRYIEVINSLSILDASIFIVGFDQLSFSQPNVHKVDLNKVVYESLDAIILPVAGTDRTGKVNITYSECKDVYVTEEIINKTPEHCVIYTGTTNTFLNTLARTCNRTLISLFDRDDIAILNSIPTAEGTLQIAMEETDYTIHSSHVIVLGFGRVGLTIARLFSAVGAHVHVCVRNPTDIARIVEMGLTPVKFEDLKQAITPMHICINTIPHPIIIKNILDSMDSSTLIIDLASAPGGTDFEFAKKKDIKALHALGLPGKVAPKSAGEVLSQVLIQLIKGKS